LPKQFEACVHESTAWCLGVLIMCTVQSSAQCGRLKFEIISTNACPSSWEPPKKSGGSCTRKELVASWPLWPNLVQKQISKVLDFLVALGLGIAVFRFRLETLSSYLWPISLTCLLAIYGVHLLYSTTIESRMCTVTCVWTALLIWIFLLDLCSSDSDCTLFVFAVRFFVGCLWWPICVHKMSCPCAWHAHTQLLAEDDKIKSISLIAGGDQY
jgi:hypothetical protein